MNNDDAIREAHRNYEEKEYFDSRPAIDCNDRRRVFEAGFDRGWKSARDDVERFLKDGETIEQCLERNRRDIDTLMGMLAIAKNETSPDQHTCGWPKCGHLRVDGSTSFGWCQHQANRITTEGPLGFTPSVSFSGGCARHTGYAETAQESHRK